MFNRLGRGIATRPGLFVLAWAMAIAAAVAWSMLSPPHPPVEVGSFLPPGSLALKMGFKPIPVEQIGPYKDEYRASWPPTSQPG